MSDNPLAADLDHVLDHTRSLWEELRGERLFITGGTGFFGCWLLESLAWANERLGLNAQAVVLTRNPRAFAAKAPHLASHASITLLEGDVRSFEFPAGVFSHIIHAATEASTKLNAENPLLMLDTIVEGTRRALDFSVSCGARKFLLVSSGAVYGRQPADLACIPEEYNGSPDPLDPKSAYAEGKRVAEQQCTLYARETPVEMKIARCFAFVGPHMPLDAHYAVGNFILDGLKGGPVVVLGDGSPVYSYLYAADLVIWLLRILFKGQSCRPYNVGSDQCLSISELARLVALQFNSSMKIEIRGHADPFRPMERYVPDIGRILEELNVNIWVNLTTSIQRTIRWHLK